MQTVEHFYLTWVFPGCKVVHYPRTSYTETVFDDGRKVPASPIDSAEYRETAKRLGYGDDTARMSLEHEFLHSFLSLCRGWPHSPTLWALAHGEPANEEQHQQEEAYVCAFAAFLNGVDMPWCPDWYEWDWEAAEELRYWF